MIYFAEIGEGGFIKIGQSRYPWRRMEGLANFYRKNVTLLAEKRGGYETEFYMHKKFGKYRISKSEFGETYTKGEELMAYIEKFKLDKPLLRVYRTKAESKRTPTLMTHEVVKRVGELLNGGMSGPQVAKKLGVSTASIYAFWKHAGKGRFVRKPKLAGNTEKK